MPNNGPQPLLPAISPETAGLIAAWCEDARLSEASARDLMRIAELLVPLASVVRADISLAAVSPDGARCQTLVEMPPRSVRSLYGQRRKGQSWSLQSHAMARQAYKTGRPAFCPYAYLVGGQAASGAAVPIRLDRAVRALLLLEYAMRSHPGPRRGPPAWAAAGLVDRFPEGSVTRRETEALLRMAVGIVAASNSGRRWVDEKAGASPPRRIREAEFIPFAPGVPSPALPLETAEGEGWRQYFLLWGDRTVVKTDVLLGPAATPSGWLFDIETIASGSGPGQSEGIRSVVLQEVHHRVKNNLQTIASLLRLQARRAGRPEIQDALAMATERVMSVAAIYDALSREGQESVDLWDMLQRLVDSVRQADPLRPAMAGEGGERIQWLLRGDRVTLPAAEATSVALAVNELLQNTVRHAFPDGRSGTVHVELRLENHSLAIVVEDDGCGIAAPAGHCDSPGLGLQLIHRLVEEDLRGQFSAVSGNGTRAEIRIPLPKHQ